MIRISSMNRTWVSALITLSLIFTMIFVTSPTAFAHENLSPRALTLSVTDVTGEASSVQELHLGFSNDPGLSRETNSLIKKIEESGLSFAGLSVQVQLKTDNAPWKIYRVGEFGTIPANASSSSIRLLSGGIPDLIKQTVYAKVRYAWMIEGGGAYYGAWSETAAIGKDAPAVEDPKTLSTAPQITEASIDYSPYGYPQFNILFGDLPEEVTQSMTNPNGSLMVNVMISENGKAYRNIRFQQASNLKSGEPIQCSLFGNQPVYEAGTVTMKVRFEWYSDGVTYYSPDRNPDVASPWSAEISDTVELWANASKWALPELERAKTAGLIPGVLMGTDFTKSVTRAEFAAAAVKTYEAMSGKEAEDREESPFTDCSDAEVLKAYDLGIVNGTAATTFAPNERLTREQAAVMMTRVYKLVHLKGWTLATDSQFPLEYTAPKPFSDDNKISAYAKDSVYFMTSQGIVNGIGNNAFAPKNTTYSERKKGYANATRQQALLISLRMTENLSAPA